MLCLY
jgi:hypothetical protein